MAKKSESVRLPTTDEVGTLPASVAVADAPALASYKVNFRRTQWLTSVLVVAGCTDADDARRKLHEALDEAILQIEKGR